jgi:glycosyltransferase involved in cell wall biosynthesis
MNQVDTSPVKGQKFLWLNMPPWDNVWTRQNHFALRFAKLGAEILYVETPRSLAGSLRDRNWRAPFARSKVRGVAEGLDIMTLPPVLPGSMRSEVMAHLVSAQIVQAVNKEIQQRGWQKFIAWNRVPLNVHILPRLRPAPFHTVYDITDDYGAYLPKFRALTDHRERNLLQQVDIAFATSDLLIPPLRQYNLNIHHLPNGVDFELFSQVGSRELKINPAVANIPKPIIGYVGLVAEWFDHDIVEALGERWPGQIVVIGPVKPSEVRRVNQNRNVCWLGFVERSQLPGYLQTMDVCILPRRNNELTTKMNPLKLWEYLATGKPIVSTDMPALDPCRNLISVATSTADFVAKVEAVVNKPEDPERAIERRRIAQQNSWDRLFERLLEKMYPLLEQSS